MIEIRHLAKRFGALQAVQDLSMQLHPGEVLGFLGPNGAGKSTTMKMITGFFAPDSGEVLIQGVNVQQDPIGAQKLIGYLPEGAPSYSDMQVQRFLNFIAEVRGYRGAEKQAVVDEAIRNMDLRTVAEQRIDTLSKGFKRRVGLAQAILHDPKVLILDEPTDGLDPNQKHQVRDLIRSLSKDKIVIISTHILEEVTAVCSRVVIMSAGQLVEDCTPADLEQRSCFHGAVTLILSEAPHPQFIEAVNSLDGVARLQQSGTELVIFPANDASLFESLKSLCHQEQVQYQDIYRERGRLDDVFRQITAGSAA
jgi:ABC-2 type transport system ATP-binding protein